MECNVCDVPNVAKSDNGSGNCRQQALGIVTESVRRLNAKFGSVPLLNAKTDLKVKASAHKKLHNKLDRLDGILDQSALYSECALLSVVWTGQAVRRSHMTIAQ